MGSTPSSSEQKKGNVNLVEIAAVESLEEHDHNFLQNNKESPVITKNKPIKVNKNTTITNNNNEEFTTSVEQMKTQMELNNALSSLKKNQLLSTVEFKRLQMTEHLAPTTNKKEENTPLINGEKKDRYHYKKVVGKRSELAVREKRTESSINVSSLTSTYINEGLVEKSNERDYEMMRKENHNKKFVKESSSPEVIVELLMKKRQLSNNNQLQQKQHVKTQNVHRQEEQLDVYELSSNNNDNVHVIAEYEEVLDHKKIIEINKKNIDLNKRKKSKFVKSEKFITNNLSDRVDNYYDRDGVIVMDEIEER